MPHSSCKLSRTGEISEANHDACGQRGFPMSKQPSSNTEGHRQREWRYSIGTFRAMPRRHQTPKLRQPVPHGRHGVLYRSHCGVCKALALFRHHITLIIAHVPTKVISFPTLYAIHTRSVQTCRASQGKCPSDKHASKMGSNGWLLQGHSQPSLSHVF